MTARADVRDAELVEAVAAAMTLFGRVEIRKVTAWSEIADLSLRPDDRLVA